MSEKITDSRYDQYAFLICFGMVGLRCLNLLV